MLTVLLKFSVDPIQARKDSNIYAIIYVGLGVLTLIIYILQQIIYYIIG
jgi:hypothetical protein